MPADIVAPLILGMTFILTVGGTLIFRGPLGKALAERIAGRSEDRYGDGEVQRLRQEVEDLRGALGEVQERLDFAERLLVQRRDPELPGPAR